MTPSRKHLAVSHARPIDRTGWALGMLLAGATALTVWSANAWAAPTQSGSTPRAEAAMIGPHGGHMGGGMMMGMPLGGPGLDRLLDAVKATEPQRKQIHDISDQAHADLKALHDRLPKGPDGRPVQPHRAILMMLTQPQVDAAGAEKLRQQSHAQHDAVSQRMLQAATDIAKVLTPEQRGVVAKELQARFERRDDRREERRSHRPGPGREDGGRPDVR